MSVWFFLVLVIGIVYALNRLTSTTDLPVSARLAEARSIVEQGRRSREAGETSEHAPEPVAASTEATPASTEATPAAPVLAAPIRNQRHRVLTGRAHRLTGRPTGAGPSVRATHLARR